MRWGTPLMRSEHDFHLQRVVKDGIDGLPAYIVNIIILLNLQIQRVIIILHMRHRVHQVDPKNGSFKAILVTHWLQTHIKSNNTKVP